MLNIQEKYIHYNPNKQNQYPNHNNNNNYHQYSSHYQQSQQQQSPETRNFEMKIFLNDNNNIKAKNIHESLMPSSSSLSSSAVKKNNKMNKSSNSNSNNNSNIKTPLKKFDTINKTEKKLDLDQITKKINFQNLSSSSTKANNLKKKLLGEFNIKLNEMNQKLLRIYEDDDIIDVIHKFCEANNIDHDTKLQLIQQIIIKLTYHDNMIYYHSDKDHHPADKGYYHSDKDHHNGDKGYYNGDEGPHHVEKGNYHSDKSNNQYQDKKQYQERYQHVDDQYQHHEYNEHDQKDDEDEIIEGSTINDDKDGENFMLEIVMPNKKSEILRIYEDSIPMNIALKLHKKHNLKLQEIEMISSFIQVSQEEYFQKVKILSEIESITEEVSINSINEKQQPQYKHQLHQQEQMNQTDREYDSNDKIINKNPLSANKGSKSVRFAEENARIDPVIIDLKVNNNIENNISNKKNRNLHSWNLNKVGEQYDYGYDENNYEGRQNYKSLDKMASRGNGSNKSVDKSPIGKAFQNKGIFSNTKPKLQQYDERGTPISYRLAESKLSSEQKRRQYIEDYFRKNYPLKPELPQFFHDYIKNKQLRQAKTNNLSNNQESKPIPMPIPVQVNGISKPASNNYSLEISSSKNTTATPNINQYGYHKQYSDEDYNMPKPNEILSYDEMSILKEIFSELDSDNDGKITVLNLHQLGNDNPYLANILMKLALLIESTINLDFKDFIGYLLKFNLKNHLFEAISRRDTQEIIPEIIPPNNTPINYIHSD